MFNSEKNKIFKLISKHLDIKRKNFRNFSYIPCFSSKRCRNYKFSEIGEGVTINILKFYLNRIRKKSNLKGKYCVCRNYSKNNILVHGNTICYTEECVPVIEKCIYDLDLFKAAVMGVVSAKNKIKEIERRKRLTKQKKAKIIDNYISTKIKKRKRMWIEINEGIKRLLGERKGKNVSVLNETDFNSERMKFLNKKILIFHGDQLRDWNRRNIYWQLSEKPKIISLAHYHVMIPMIRFNTLIIFNGHYLEGYKTILNDYYFSHIGTSCFDFSIKSQEIEKIKFLRHR